MRKENVQDTFAYLLGFRPARTVMHRILIVGLHILGWSLFLTLPLLIYRIEITNTFYLYREIVNKIFLIILFYFNFYFLIPKFFQKKRYVAYFFAVLASLLVICLQQLLLETFIQKKFGKTPLALVRSGPRRIFHRLAPIGKMEMGPLVGTLSVNSDSTAISITGPEGRLVENIEYRRTTDQEPDSELVQIIRAMPAEAMGRDHFIESGIASSRPGIPISRNFSIQTEMPLFRILGTEIPLMALPMLLMDTLTSAILILLISGFIKLANSLFISEKQKKILETERLNAELNYLKLQINPHFLFNTLNSIYSQAHLRSEQTEYSILKFSQIMRYVLYDTSADKISLRKDMEYISNYIDLQKLRLSRNVVVTFDVSGNTDNLLIAPLLLITYIENAFKHGISYTAPSVIKIAIDITGNMLQCTVSNTIVASRSGGHHGVGQTNALRRLDVLYPGRYWLDVVDNNSLYVVNLKIELDHEA